MQYQQLGSLDLKVSRLGFGFFRIHEKSVEEAEELISICLENGINFFDHADIYGKGVGESYMGSYLLKHPEDRSRMIIQTKCDIHLSSEEPNTYDTSYDYILDCVKNSLERLHTDYLDILLLHRPDALMDPKEVARAFSYLYEHKMVRYFGVSNFSPLQMAVLQKHWTQPLVVNQIQLSLVHSCAFDSRVFFNMKEDEGCNRDGGILDYCYLNDVTIQAWSPLMASWAEGCFLDHRNYKALNEVLEQKAKKYHVEKNAIAIAWILKHPYKIQPILGTTSKKHLQELLEAVNIELTRQDWYDLYQAQEKPLP